jgi:hypothetical protein
MQLTYLQQLIYAIPKIKGGILAMFGGGIYTSQKCTICGKNLKDNYRNAVECSDHPEFKADKIRVHFKGVKRRFENYSDAYGFLITLRGKDKEGEFDQRDYSADKPLSVSSVFIGFSYKKLISV